MKLTEQWNKGKLSEGDYYIERRNGYLLYDNIDSHGVWRNSIDEDIVEVLAPVPSYEEWRSTGKFAMEAIKVAEENQQLKELLKECRNYINKVAFCTPNCYKTLMEDLLTKIDNAIGEKKCMK